ncbi:hypothetical protein MLD38_036044 [Melastoma candidum]|uniref:Uncharacterized protein n=1 Tax=Melastoma candidum TaxID=119954 RepID=A0ACB9LJE3_9MYRT|nr:hypothetical protein MLD38_036044 [Melastoma candidum]
MARAPGGSVGPGGKTGVRIVVVGDRGTGKSSLICTAATEVFPGNVPPFLPPTRLPEDTYPDRVPITIIDTSSRVEESSKLGEELRRADAVVLTYACEHPETLDRPSTFWLPELRRLEACPHMRLCIDLQYFFYQYIRKIVLLDNFYQFCLSFPFLFQIPELAANLIPIPVKKCPDQSVELTNEAIHFIEGIFDLFDGDADGALRPMEIECDIVFATLLATSSGVTGAIGVMGKEGNLHVRWVKVCDVFGKFCDKVAVSLVLSLLGSLTFLLLASFAVIATNRRSR